MYTLGIPLLYHPGYTTSHPTIPPYTTLDTPSSRCTWTVVHWVPPAVAVSGNEALGSEEEKPLGESLPGPSGTSRVLLLVWSDAQSYSSPQGEK